MDRSIGVHVKLLNDGVLVIGIYRRGRKPVMRCLTPAVNYDD